MPRIAAIARYTLLEARRIRLPVLLLLTMAAMLLVAAFAAELAIIEGARVRAAVYASGMRLAAVCIAGFFVLASVTREFNDKGIDVLLALDIPRAHYILGRLVGFVAVGVLAAAAACVPLLVLAPAAAALQWGLSLALELVIVCGLALFCVITIAQVPGCALFLLAFYGLARSLAAIRLISANPVGGADTWSHQFVMWLVEGLALVMPAFERWTQTAWLVNEPAAWSALARIGGEALVYAALLAAAAIFDFQRRNF